MTTPATLQNLLALMKQNRDVLNGWDIVFNMLEDPVNDFLQVVFTDQAPATWKKIDLWYCQVTPNPSGPGQLVVYTDLSVTLANPKLQFLGKGHAAAQVTFAVDGSIKTAAKAVAAGFVSKDCDVKDTSLKWQTTPLESTTMVGTVPLTVLTGTTTDASSGFRTVLDFPAGSFRFPGIPAQTTDADKLSAEVQGYFADHDVRYVINQVNSKVPHQSAALTPKGFKLNTLTTNTGKYILQFFVATQGPEQANLTINVNEPIPDGYGATLMVSRVVASHLGSADFQQSGLFALENLAFPGEDVLVLQGSYSPHDTLILGDFQPNDSVSIVSGDKQSVVRTGDAVPGGQAAFAPLQLKVTDPLGKPAANASVLFVASGPDNMSIQLSADGERQSVTTNPQGIATLAAIGGHSAVCYYAEGPFTIIATGPGGATATFHLTVAPTPPPPNLKDYTVTIVSGDGQQVPRTGIEVPGGIAKFEALKVVVKDPSGNIAPHALVKWAIGSHPGSMAVQIDPSGAAPVEVRADDQGVCVLGGMPGSASVYAYYDEAAFGVVASLQGGGSVTFSLTVIASPPLPSYPGSTVTITKGDNQSVARTGTDVPGGIATFGPLQVVLKDSSGKVIPGARIDWKGESANPGMAVQSEEDATLTDHNGLATLSGVRVYYAQGPCQVIASVHGGGSAAFSLTVPPAPPPPSYPGAMLTITAGDHQSVARTASDVSGGTAKFAPLAVLLRDKNGNPIPNAHVDWDPVGSGGLAVQVDPSGATPATVTTDSNGVATLNRMPGGTGVWVYYGTGNFKVIASVNGGPSVTFSGNVPH